MADDQNISKRIEKDVSSSVKNIEDDIKAIEKQHESLNKFTMDIDGQINNLKNIIRLETDAAKKGKLYTVLNTSMEIMARYQELLIKSMTVKFNYRREQNETMFRKIKLLEIELKKANEDANDFSISAIYKLMSEMNELIKKGQTVASTSTDTEIDAAISTTKNKELAFMDILDDPKYKL